MVEAEILKKQIDEYKKEWGKTNENRARLMEMINQQERKLEQLSGAISALERLLVETEKKETESQSEKEELSDDEVNDIRKPAKG